MPNLRFAAPKEKRVAVITGGARGIGGASALRIAEEGRDIVIADILEEEAADVVREIEQIGQRALFIKTDVTDFAAVQSMVDQTVEHLRTTWTFSSAALGFWDWKHRSTNNLSSSSIKSCGLISMAFTTHIRQPSLTC